MAKPKKLTKTKIKNISTKFKKMISEYITDEKEVDFVSEAVSESMLRYLQNRDNRIIDEVANRLSGVVDPKNITSTGASGGDDGFHVRTKGQSQRSDSVKGL